MDEMREPRLKENISTVSIFAALVALAIIIVAVFFVLQANKSPYSEEILDDIKKAVAITDDVLDGQFDAKLAYKRLDSIYEKYKDMEGFEIGSVKVYLLCIKTDLIGLRSTTTMTELRESRNNLAKLAKIKQRKN